MVLSTGPDTYQGFSISVHFLPKSSIYHLIVRLITSDSIYQVFVTEFGERDEWLNVGIVVASAETSAGVNVEVYRNGHALMTTSSPISQDSSNPYSVNPSPGIYIGSAITTMVNMSTVPIASGTINMLGKSKGNDFTLKKRIPQIFNHQMVIETCSSYTLIKMNHFFSFLVETSRFVWISTFKLYDSHGRLRFQ